MRNNPRILVVEDDPSVIIFIVDTLEYMGFEVLTARNGVDGLKLATREKPDLIVLDVMMPELDGYEVCRHIKLDPETRHIPILMLTAKGQLRDKLKGFDVGAEDYLAKPYDKGEFEARIKALLKRTTSTPFHSAHDDSNIIVSLVPGHRIGIRVSGTTSLNATSRDVLQIDPDVYARQADNTPRLDWRFNSKQWGKQLYQQILISHPEVLGNYNHALGEKGGEKEKLHVIFESPRDLLRVPLEFLFEGVNDGGDYLVLDHPMARSITGVRVHRMGLSPNFFNELAARGDEVKILLIASNTEPDIPGVDGEIQALANSLGLIFEKRGIALQITTLSTEVATYETVRKILKNCKHHIIHYAGHGYYNEKSPEKSCLYFWERENKQGNLKEMPASELQILLQNSDLRFAYLSCCLGTKTSEKAKLIDDDFLGLADSIIHAGVPSVLGFRWPVSDFGAQEIALRFYDSLTSKGKVDTALLDARREVAAKDRDDITWLSPILILQT